MRLLGAFLAVLGVCLSLYANPLFLVVTTIGFILFLEAIENSIKEHITGCLEREKDDAGVQEEVTSNDS